MKTTIGFIAAFIMVLFTSCSPGVNPQDEVGFAAAFGHLLGDASYMIWLFVTVIVVGGIGYFYVTETSKKGNEISPLIIFGLAALIMIAIFQRPAEMGTNTTVEMSKRGVWIR